MRIKCEACGAKIRNDEIICPKCGYELYTSEFRRIACEIDNEMKEISDVQLDSVRQEIQRENIRTPQKMTFEEFESMYIRENNIQKPRQNARRSANIFNIAMTASYDSMIKQAYKEYLRRLGYDF